ncbi:ABC transporter permease [Candidatus Acetothermia bacterium]|jgi:ABC-2 type transport system permease protein|nr:ABC transporter permease [Candidatus Acetothermia bacterium]MCI2427139.1 ABC transporter permease [Candidatus Acetothermia bacterium]MCI2428661.1 ABC transporter permease [Candidatus Acetothermia bacterium]
MNLKQLVSLTAVEIRNFLREPVASLLIITAAILFLIFAAAYGDDPAPGGLRMVDFQVPSFIAMSIAMIGLMNIPYAMVEYKAVKVFKRFKGTPLEPAYILVAQAVVSFLIVLTSALILIGTATVVFDIQFQVDILNFALAFGLSSATFMSLGFILAGLLRSTRAVEGVTGILFFPLFFLSGIMIPLNAFPQWIQDAAEFNPVAHSMDILTATWIGNCLNDHTRAIIILCSITVLCTIVAIKTFRWE